MSKSKHLNSFKRIFSPDFTIQHDPLECVEELNFLPDTDLINEIKNHQSRHLEYEYETDLKTWIR